eukprot:scaffold27859_cov55-Attheya_sp.AAC.5
MASNKNETAAFLVGVQVSEGTKIASVKAMDAHDKISSSAKWWLGGCDNIRTKIVNKDSPPSGGGALK